MNTMHLRDIHLFHAHGEHHMAERFGRMLRDYRFWVVMAALVYIAIITMAVIFGGMGSGEGMPEVMPYMYGY